ncbi:MAG: hypothetical protein OEZ52_17215, partial [Candidatus Aminicenantes bacterium]|nr:hypothetical protein [Candidatus Aminicenantes bacterium]
VDFSDDGAFLVAAGASSSSNLAVFDTNPDSTYGAYNLLGTAAPIAGSINSVVFFPGDNSRTLTTSASPRTSVVSIVTLTPNVTDPIGIPPTATVITDIVLGSGRIADGGVMAIVSNNLHGIITDGRGSSSGSSSTSCYGCSVLSHWDLNPSSATYGQRYNLATPSQPATYNGGGNEQNYPKLLSGNMSNDGFRVIASSPGSRYEPSWIDFTKHFTDNGYPDNKVVVGPYFVEHVWSNSGCFMMSVTQVCTAVCSDFGGCYGYTITSRLTLEQRGELAQKQTDFDDLITQMDAMEAASPYAGYYLDRYVFQPIQ